MGCVYVVVLCRRVCDVRDSGMEEMMYYRNEDDGAGIWAFVVLMIVLGWIFLT